VCVYFTRIETDTFAHKERTRGLKTVRCELLRFNEDAASERLFQPQSGDTSLHSTLNNWSRGSETDRKLHESRDRVSDISVRCIMPLSFNAQDISVVVLVLATRKFYVRANFPAKLPRT